MWRRVFVLWLVNRLIHWDDDYIITLLTKPIQQINKQTNVNRVTKYDRTRIECMRDKNSNDNSTLMMNTIVSNNWIVRLHATDTRPKQAEKTESDIRSTELIHTHRSPHTIRWVAGEWKKPNCSTQITIMWSHRCTGWHMSLNGPNEHAIATCMRVLLLISVACEFVNTDNRTNRLMLDNTSVTSCRTNRGIPKILWKRRRRGSNVYLFLFQCVNHRSLIGFYRSKFLFLFQ